MTTRLTLICHGATAATRAARFPGDEPLDAAGETAAAAAAALPAREAAVTRAARRFTAPERRTQQSAAAFGLPFADEAALREVDAGRWAGRSLSDVAAAEPEALAAWTRNADAVPHGGESLADAVARVERWMEGQAALGGRVVGVTHPTLVRAAVALAVGAGPGSIWRVEAAPLAAATLSHDGRRWTLVGLVPA